MQVADDEPFICTSPCRWKGLEKREKARFEAMARRRKGALL